MEFYNKTVWVVNETKLNPSNMNKIEDQLETLTNKLIDEEAKDYITSETLEAKNYADKDYVTNLINSSIGSALEGEY